MNTTLKIAAIGTMVIVAAAVFFHLLWKPFYANYKYEKCVASVKAEQQRRTEVDVAAKAEYVKLINSGVYKEPEPKKSVPDSGFWQGILSDANDADLYRTHKLVELRQQIGPDIDWAKPFSLESGLMSCKI